MTKNNTKKAVAQAISTAVALGWVIMQVESAQAATFVVNNLNDSGVGSLRDTINIANNNDVVEFLLGSHPSTISLTSGALAIAKNLTINGPGTNLLTISSNNHFPVFDINAADVTFSGLAIAGNINAYNSSNLTFINSTISGDNLKIDNPTGELRLINSTIKGNNSVNINANELTLTNGSEVRDLSNIGNAGDLTISTGSLTILDSANINSGQISNGSGGNIFVQSPILILRSLLQPSTIAGGTNNSGVGGNISIDALNGFIIAIPNEPSDIAGGSNNSGGGGTVTITASGIIGTRVLEPSAIAGGNINSGAGGTLTVTVSDVILLRRVPEPSVIAGSILAGSLAWLAKRKQTAFRKAKV
ncbi:PEP-CTERM sorting domain-containing protein [Nostoc sp. CHAB 5784]|uniref:PEP-CTERM sorting domain-containing protein n=1 Tax=Nostoc mirabile TaxID=2907820 RepID=UPI001E3536B9|nr:PEP-CTERM sorting domain-containing protein [Nostoc mirabile]MCC5662379.1 PEP-CTERM sorting domain-containing protein [Nostoc mirabile CHAB5784]